jgi:hypothetical protein
MVLSLQSASAYSADAIVIDPTKKVTDNNTKTILLTQGINPDYVELVQDYAAELTTIQKTQKALNPSTRDLPDPSPYTKTYKDRWSGQYVTEFSELPMVNADGVKVNTTWTTRDGKNFTAGVNQFIATVAEGKVTITAINDQSDSKIKKDSVLTFQPQLFLGVKEIKPVANAPTLLSVDPLNPNYTNNTLVWDYGIAKRYLRLIEGGLLGSWVFNSHPGDRSRIKYNQTGDFTLKLGRFASGTDEEIIPKDAFDNPQSYGFLPAQYPLTINDSLTFYPDAHPETATVDGRVNRDVAGSTWAQIRDGAGNNVADSDNYLTSQIQGSGAGTWKAISRAILLFNTAAIPDDAIISGATLTEYGLLKADPSAWALDVNVYGSTPASNTALVTGDYQQVGTTAYSTPIAYGSINTGAPGAPNNFAFNAAGLAAINKTGITKLGNRNANYDVANSPPVWANSNAYIAFHSSEMGAGYKPTLVVVYTTSPTVTTGAASSILYTTATGSGNITATGGENSTIRGFEWDIDSGAPYANDVHEHGNFGTGAFSLSMTGLSANTTYYYRAYATNPAGTGYGAESSFTTPPLAEFNATYISPNQIDLDWIAPVPSNNVTIRANIGSYPPLITDGYLVYTGNLTAVSDTAFNFDDLDEVYYTAWSDNGTAWSIFGQDKAGGNGMVLILLFGVGLVISGFAIAKRETVVGIVASAVWLACIYYTRQNPIGAMTTGDTADTAILAALIGLMVGVPIMSFQLSRRERAKEAQASEDLAEQKEPTLREASSPRAIPETSDQYYDRLHRLTRRPRR